MYLLNFTLGLLVGFTGMTALIRSIQDGPGEALPWIIAFVIFLVASLVAL